MPRLEATRGRSLSRPLANTTKKMAHQAEWQNDARQYSTFQARFCRLLSSVARDPGDKAWSAVKHASPLWDGTAISEKNG